MQLSLPGVRELSHILPSKACQASLQPGAETQLSVQELLLKLVEDNYPLASDPDAVPGKKLCMYNTWWLLLPGGPASTMGTAKAIGHMDR